MDDLERLCDAARHGSLEEVRGILVRAPELAVQRDGEGATALHYAALGGHRAVVELLVKHGADINAADGAFGATPAGWAIEYMRELEAFLGIELSDLAYAIRKGDVEWVKRFVTRFPALREACDTDGTDFKELARASGNVEIMRLLGVQHED